MVVNGAEFFVKCILKTFETELRKIPYRLKSVDNLIIGHDGMMKRSRLSMRVG